MFFLFFRLKFFPNPKDGSLYFYSRMKEHLEVHIYIYLMIIIIQLIRQCTSAKLLECRL